MSEPEVLYTNTIKARVRTNLENVDILDEVEAIGAVVADADETVGGDGALDVDHAGGGGAGVEGALGAADRDAQVGAADGEHLQRALVGSGGRLKVGARGAVRVRDRARQVLEPALLLDVAVRREQHRARTGPVRRRQATALTSAAAAPLAVLVARREHHQLDGVRRQVAQQLRLRLVHHCRVTHLRCICRTQALIPLRHVLLSSNWKTHEIQIQRLSTSIYLEILEPVRMTCLEMQVAHTTSLCANQHVRKLYPKKDQ